MNKIELQQKLTEKGVEFDKRWGLPKLQEIYDKSEKPTYSEEQLKNIADDVSGKNKMTTDELLSGTIREDGNAVTKSGILIPPQVLANLPQTKYKYMVSCDKDKCVIERINPRGEKEFFRIYSMEMHGADFAKFANSFVQKNNK